MMKTSSVRSTLAALLAFLAVTPGCGGGGGGSGGGGASARSTEHSTAAVLPVVIVERWLAYLAEEAATGPGGTDLNNNGSLVDAVASVVDMRTGTTRVLGVQADDIAIIRSQANGAHLFTVTDESADVVDWNMDLDMDDVVLLHTDLSAASAMMFVAELDDSGPCRFVTVDDRLYFQEDDSGLAAGETSIMYVDTLLPLTPVRVPNADAAGTLDPELMACDEGLIFLTLDETGEGRDLNTDGDTADTDVLALLDGTDAAALVFEVPLALADDSGPVRALPRAANDWIVAFLVDESGQDDTNFNTAGLFTPSWRPLQCVGDDDVDTQDEVLHYLFFANYTADPSMSPPRNTGLVGDDRVLVVRSGGSLYVATVSDEADEGTCALNDDGDQDDDILRWVEAVPGAGPLLPFTNSTGLVALEDVAGNTDGATDLDGRFVCVVSESDDDRDHSGDALLVDDLVAFLDPADGNSAQWTFDQFQPPPPPFDPVGTTWMYERPERDTILIVFPERFVPADLNGDGDQLDSVPAFGVFEAGGAELDFTGPLVAVPPTNAGFEFANNIGFFRADEARDELDWNGDGDQADRVLLRAPLNSLVSVTFVSSLNNLAGSAIVRPDPNHDEVAVAFLADESVEGADYNADGDTNDLVLRWVRVD